MHKGSPRFGTLNGRLAATSMRALRHRPFMLYTLGNGFSLTGTWMQRLALGWLVWEMTRSGFWLGVLAAADLLPVTVIGPFAGVAADRLNRLALTRLTQIATGIIAFALAILVLLDLLNIFNLLLLATMQGCMVALNQPSRLALVQILVPREDVGAAVALSSVNVNLARITGPAVAGWMLVHFPVAWIFLANAALTFGFVFLLFHLKAGDRQAKRAYRNIAAELKDGLVYTLSQRGIRTLLFFLFVGGIALRSMLELAPALAARSFRTEEIGLAFLTSSMAAGAVIAGLLTSGTSDANLLLRSALANWALGALAVCLLAIGSMPAAAVAAMSLLGFFVTRALVGTQTYIQLSVPDEVRGRALSIHGVVTRGSPALGALAIGSLSEVMDLGIPIFMGGVVLLLAAGLGLVFVRAT